MKLYQYPDELEAIANECIDAETGELDEALYAEKLNALNLERDAKVNGIIHYYLDLGAMDAAVLEEAKKMNARAKSIEKKMESLEKYLSFALNKTNYQTEDKLHGIKFTTRKDAKVEILDETIIPRKFIIKKVEEKPDKKAIKEALKGGAKVKGAQLVDTESVQIK